jgi:ubiquinone/menaquinone biosynthesis C-methylase UbiE
MKKLAAVAAICVALYGQAANKANERYRTPDGREAVAKGLGAANRDERQKPRELVEALQLRPGMSVADIGTGVGYMLPFLSKAVGSEGRVMAEDIFDDFLAQAKAHVADASLTNVTFVKGTEHGPRLPPRSVDVALALDYFRLWRFLIDFHQVGSH